MSDSISRNSDERDIMPDPDAKPWFEPMTDGISRIANFSERAREAKAPGVLDLSPTGDSGGLLPPVVATHVRMRIDSILHSCAAAGRFELRIGGIVYVFNKGIGLQSWEFPIEIDRGVDVSMVETGAAATAWNCYIFYYPE